MIFQHAQTLELWKMGSVTRKKRTFDWMKRLFKLIGYKYKLMKNNGHTERFLAIEIYVAATYTLLPEGSRSLHHAREAGIRAFTCRPA